MQRRDETWKATEVYGTGWPANAGGTAGRLAGGLPYALAEAEQNFLIPSREQALIWGDLVPQMIVSAVIPRWWNVTPLQLHWVGCTWLTPRRCWPKRAEPAAAAPGGERALERYAPPARIKKIDATAGRGRRHSGAVENVRALGDVRCWPANWRRRSGLARWPPRSAAWPRRHAEQLNHARHFARLRHSQADAGQFLSAGAAEPAHVPHADGLFQPHSGGKLGIEPALLRGAGRPDARRARAAERAGSGVDPADRGAIFATHLEDWPALLRSPADGGRRCASEKARNGTAAAASDQTRIGRSRALLTRQSIRQTWLRFSLLVALALGAGPARPSA